MLEVTVLEGLATNPMDEILSRSKIQALLVNSFHIKIKLLKICPLRKFPDISSNKWIWIWQLKNCQNIEEILKSYPTFNSEICINYQRIDKLEYWNKNQRVY